MKLAIIGYGSLVENIVRWLGSEEVELVWYLPPSYFHQPQKYTVIDGVKKIFDPIVRLQKEYEFSGQEEVPMRDLFRIVTRYSPKSSIENQTEVWQKLPQELQQDWMRPMEQFECFDGVLEFFQEDSAYRHPFLGENTYALDEQSVIHRYPQFFLSDHLLSEFLQGRAKQKIFIHGRPQTSWEQEYFDQLWEGSLAGHWEVVWSSGFYQAQVSQENSFFQNHSVRLSKREKEASKDYFQALDAWNELESYEKAKHPRPALPAIGWMELGSQKIQSFTKLYDRDGLLIELGVAPWLASPAKSESKVINVDVVWSIQSLLYPYQSLFMPKPSQGQLVILEKSVDAEAKVRQNIEKEIFSHFTKIL